MEKNKSKKIIKNLMSSSGKNPMFWGIMEENTKGHVTKNNKINGRIRMGKHTTKGI